MLDDCLKARGNCNNCDRKNMCFPKKEKKEKQDGRIIAELEKIKWEIIHTEGCCNYTYCRQCITIIDNRIEELKQEKQ